MISPRLCFICAVLLLILPPVMEVLRWYIFGSAVNADLIRDMANMGVVFALLGAVVEKR